jgi:putative FmdB family regulatory protein
MPAYDYNCKDCDLTFEVRHSMLETPIVICPKCQSRKTHKVPAAVGFITRSGRNVAMDRAKDQVKRNVDMKEDLRSNLGIEKIHPLRGATMNQIYQDSKTQASFIKERMAAQAEKRAKETSIKQKEWTKKALARTPQRAKERAAHKAAEAAAKRAIKV